MKLLITGGAGFIGSSLAIAYKRVYPQDTVISLDNLKRRGSELNLPRLKHHGVEFVHGDIRNREDVFGVGNVDAIIECSAEPSVLAGYKSSPEYLVNTNLCGTINCLDLARESKAKLIFLSTSRVYPIKPINSLYFKETETRFELENEQHLPGASRDGLTEDFLLNGTRSLYGATKLCSEIITQEYCEMYDLKAVVNRCGVVTGPWQMGKVDQGFMVFWLANHYWKKSLKYFGYGGTGKQVRDVLFVDDLFELIMIQLKNIDTYSGQVFNVGGGRDNSVSLLELTALCKKYTGNTVAIEKVTQDRIADIRIYLTDNSKVTNLTGWQPKHSPDLIVKEIYKWIKANEKNLKGIFE